MSDIECAGEACADATNAVVTAYFEDTFQSGLTAAEGLSGVRSLFCVTVYNEPAALVLATVASLWRSLEDARRSGFRHSGDACIALVLDGNEPADAQLLATLCAIGLTQQARLAETEFFFSLIAPLSFPWRMAADALPCERYDASAPTEPMRFVVCIKGRNRGKLHSHALFFGNLGVRMQPEFCFQIDAGTTIDRVAVGRMLRQFFAEPESGALAAQIMTPSPTLANRTLHAWQYIDFATQQALSWPAEVAMGHLSVMPGQFCGLRWAALAGPLAMTSLSSNAAVEQFHSGPETGPIGAYLRGLNTTSAIEHLMFLAEDRIIGNEIVLGPKHWKLAYCSEARATTDACSRFTELFRQRRRWNNSSAACRLSQLAQWPKFLKRTDRTRTHKLWFSIGSVWQFVLLMQQLFAPAALVCTVFFLKDAFSRFDSIYGGAFSLFTGALGVAAFALLLAPSKGAEGSARLAKGLGVLRAMMFWVLFCAITMIVIYSGVLSLAALIFCGLPLAMGLLITCARFRGSRALLALLLAQHYIILNLLIQTTLWAYSIVRLDDTSWGTKGLTRATRSKPRLRGLRNALLVAWVSINAAVVGIDQTFPSLVFKNLGVVLEFFAAIYAATVLGSLVESGMRRIRSKRTSMIESNRVALVQGGRSKAAA